MTSKSLEHIVRAVLYEGYNLYPYRRSLKSARRWMFGVVYPRAYSEAQDGPQSWSMQTQCLIEGDSRTSLEIEVRFLHLVDRRIARLATEDWRDEDDWTFVDSLEVDGTLHQSWQEAIERSVRCGALSIAHLVERPTSIHIEFPAWRDIRPIDSAQGAHVAVAVQEQRKIAGVVECSAQNIAHDLFRLTVRIVNLSPGIANSQAGHDVVPLDAFVSTHTILAANEGQFVSSIDPPQSLRDASTQLDNLGTWPVLVGEVGQRQLLLSSPIILYDYPQVAAESPGDLFDSLEIDEMLALRVMTLTDEEKRQMHAVDDRTREILRRTESLPEEQLAKLHGAIRGLKRVMSADS
jgi:hypothetical protein